MTAKIWHFGKKDCNKDKKSDHRRPKLRSLKNILKRILVALKKEENCFPPRRKSLIYFSNQNHKCPQSGKK